MKERYNVVVSSNGRILIPSAIRKQMGIEAGDSLVLHYDSELHVSSIKSKIRECQDFIKKHNKKGISLVESLKSSRMEEND